MAASANYPQLVIAGVQMDVLQNEPQRNLSKIRQFSRNAKDQHARLVVFPECALTGYCFDSRQEMVDAALSTDCAEFAAIAELSNELKIAICCGTILRTDDPTSGHTDFFNAALTWDHGKLIDTYHKAHLPLLGVDRFVKPGNCIHTPFSIDGVNIGVHICYEGGFPEVGRALTLAAADILLLPTNWPPGSGASCTAIPACRSLENKVYFMAVNRVGVERETPFIGNSSATDPAGKVLAQIDGNSEGIIFLEVDSQRSRQKKVVHEAGVYEVDRIGDRRPDLYSSLIL